MKKENGFDSESELIFIYNASSDLFSRINDFAHKIISPQTYSCSLCKITHGHTKMYREWTDYIQSLPIKVSFQYKDQWPDFHEFPLVLFKKRGEVKPLVSPEELNQTGSLGDLMDLLNEKIRVNH